jgi:hypothetical protein
VGYVHRRKVNPCDRLGRTPAYARMIHNLALTLPSSFFQSSITFSATLNASMAILTSVFLNPDMITHYLQAGNPTYTPTCNNASLISTSLSPFLNAPLTCTPSSVLLFSAHSIPRFNKLRCLRSRPGRVQIQPHPTSVTSSCNGFEKSDEWRLSDAST